jgi:Flp pilus assembly protein TadG
MNALLRMLRRRSPGNASVEMALLLPVALLLCLGLMESGNMFLAWLTMQKAAETGVRLATTGQGLDDGTRLTRITQKTLSVASVIPGGDKATVTVRSWASKDTSGSGVSGDAGGACLPVEVRVDLSYVPTIPLFEKLFPPTVALSGRERMVNEPWVPCGM